MSLILEALKKSENQRRLGESPSIGTPVMAVRRRRSLLPYLVFLIVLGLGVLWWLRRPESAPTPAPTPAAPAIATPAANPAPAAEPPIQTTRPATQPAPSRPPASERPAAPVVPASTPRPGPDAMPKPAPLPPNSRPTPVERPVAKPSTPVEPPVSKPMPSTAPGPTPKPEPAPDVERLPMFWELPLASRRELPPLNVTMHVFADDPAQRFVIVNGDRRVEGDDVGGLRLIEIRRDGIVFERDGTRFLYPRGGR